MFLEKAKLKSQIKSLEKKEQKSVWKVNRRVETSKPVAAAAFMCFKVFVLLFFGFIMLFPFYYMISASLMSYNEINHYGEFTNVDVPVIFPGAPWHNGDYNYTRAFAEGYWEAFFFSAFVMVLQIVLKITVCVLLGYAFGRYEFKGKKALWWLFMLTLMIPEVALISGQYWTTLNLVGVDNILSLSFSLCGPFIASIFTAFLFRNAFENIDDSVKEAALMDGVSGVRFFFMIAIPMILPLIWMQAILAGLASWNSYMWPQLLLASNPEYQTIPLWLFNIGTQDEFGNTYTQNNIRMAGSVLAVLPTLVFYLIFRKRINTTVSMSANKG